MSYDISNSVKRFTASGAIEAENQVVTIKSVQVTALGSDATVSIYDSTGVVVAEKKFSCHLQPGTTDQYYQCIRLHNGGYVEITGTAEVFVYL